MRTLLASLALLLATSTADAKPRKAHKPAAQSQWMRDCIHERTGPTDGVSPAEARRICTAEQPEDEVEATKAALVVARLNAKVAKAKARAAKALDACAQAVTDRCVELADPTGGTDCNVDAGLRAEFELVCLGKPPTK
ncbi:MAG TPA: hypothetical protein VJZ73_13435 [Methylomirabilota bacterium]|nr:hypothetical protein [Methylomirabilota bacterium]